MEKEIANVVFPALDRAFVQLVSPPPAIDPAASRATVTSSLGQVELARLVNDLRQQDTRLANHQQIPSVTSGLHFAVTSWVDDAFTTSPVWNRVWRTADRRLIHCFPQYQDQYALHSDRNRELARQAANGSLEVLAEVYWLAFHLSDWPGLRDRGFLEEWLGDVQQPLELYWREQFPTSPAPREPDRPAPLQVALGNEGQVRLATILVALAWLVLALVLHGAYLLSAF